MKITWGKPKVEFGKIVDGATPSSFTTMPTQKEDTVQLTTTKGTANELFGEGHELVARKQRKNTYLCEMEVFIDKGETSPIQDNDGVVDDYYHLRVTPEDETLWGFEFPKASVEVEELWSSAEGTKIKYTFVAVKPESGTMFKRYKGSTGGSTGGGSE